MKNDVVKLITIVSKTDGSGFRQEEERHEIEIMAELKSVKYAEFYQSVSAGMEVQIIVVVNIDDFDSGIIEREGRKIRPALVIYDGTEYRIIRTFMRKRKLELSLQEVE
nr:MAG TPA: putative head-tail adaptor [Caudoviricetes sp.]